jgi:hypothetical protein
MFLESLSFIYGSLIAVLDYIYDSKIFVNYKRICEWIFIGMTLFFFISNKYLCFFGSGLFTIGGLVGMILVPHAVDGFMWKMVIYLSIPIFIYNLLTIKSLIKDVPSEEIYQFVFSVMPIVIGALLLALVEEYLVPEEYSTNKIYDKIFQTIVLIGFLYYLNISKFTYFQKFTDTNKLILNIFALVWLGDVVTGLSILSNPSNFTKSKARIESS